MTSSIKDAQASPAGVSLFAGLASAAYTALGTVRDPELDQPVTTLGFVSSCTVTGEGAAQVRLRLPTYFCAPNFAFLMVADAYDAVTGVPGVQSTEVILDDHFASDAINVGVAARAGFVASFDGEATDELDDLRATFLRKAVLAGTDQVCRPLVDAGLTPAELTALTLGATPVSPELDRLRQRRRDLALPADDTSFLLLDPATGDRIPESRVPLHLRRARLTRTGIDANTSICSGMLRARYPESPPQIP
jgi:metal-sulfur cluster biosynthetic enzyme